MASNVINSYQERRKEFAKGVAYDGEIKVPNIQRTKEEKARLYEMHKKIEQEERIKQERYRAQKSYRQKMIKRKRTLAKLARRVTTVGLAGLVAFGGFKACQEYRDSKNTITLEQALENGETLESLGLDETMAIGVENGETIRIGIDAELERLNEKLNRNLTYQELAELTEEIIKLQKVVGKSKLKNALNIDNIKDIELRPAIEGTFINVDDAHYEESGIINMFDLVGADNAIPYVNAALDNKTISSEIASYIHEIDTMQEVEANMKEGDISKSRATKACKTALEETSKFAAAKMEIDEKEDHQGTHISIQKTRVSELEKEKAEKKAEEENEMEIG